MGFRKGIHYEHPPRGRARKQYTVSEAARRQRRHNLRRTRIRSDRETAIIKRLIWQLCFSGSPARSQRAVASELGVKHSYVHKVRKQAHSVGMDALANGRRVTLDDLIEARRFTERIRQEEPGLLAPTLPRRLYKYEAELRGLPRLAPAPRPAVDPPTYVIPEKYRDLKKWKEQYYAERPWLRALRT
jgi:hypothetical protein